MQGVFDLSVEAIAIQKSTISSCTRRNFTVPNSSQASNQVLVRWRGVASQPLSSNSPAEDASPNIDLVLIWRIWQIQHNPPRSSDP